MLSTNERKQIVRLHQKGKTQQFIADIVCCSQPTVGLWIKRSKKSDSLESLPRSGRPTKLKQENLAKLKRLLKQRIEKRNADFGSITTKELRGIIHKEIGELYSIRHVERIMHKLGFSLITPRTMHLKHDQKAVDSFRREFKKNFNRSMWTMSSSL